MSRRIDITGNTYDYYTVESFHSMKGSKGKENAYWNVVCKCGNKRVVEGSLLRTGKATSCGCRMRELNSTRFTKPADITNYVKRYHSYRSGARKRGLVFELSMDNFKHLLSQPCHYCKSLPVESTAKDYKAGFIVNGIDRLDNTKGYIEDNVVPCCKVCNRAKREMGYDEFIEWIDRLVVARTTSKS